VNSECGRRAEGSKLKAESRGQRIEERRQRKEGEKLGRWEEEK
jgi:hypothetical protein